MTTPIPTSAATSPASAAGQSGDGSPAGTPSDPRAVLTAMLSQGDSVATPDPEESPAVAAPAAPETPAAPPAEEAPGQPTLPAETTPTEEPADAGTPTDEPKTVPTEPDPNAALTTALTALSPTEREAALELVKEFKPGEIPRIAKLVSERHQRDETIEAQQKQIEELQGKVEAGAAATTAGAGVLPATVSKLKTVAECEARFATAKSNADALTDFLDENSGDRKDTVYDAEQNLAAVDAPADGKRYLSRQQIINKRAGWRAEVDALPHQAKVLQQTAQVSQARATAKKEMLADLPYLADPENAEVKQFAETFKAVPGLKNTLAPEFWALVYQRGLKSVNDEIAKRKGTGNGKPLFTPPKPATPTAGKVPLGKPSAPAGGAPVRPAPEAGKVKEALARNGTERSRDSFAAVLATTGR